MVLKTEKLIHLNVCFGVDAAKLMGFDTITDAMQDTPKYFMNAMKTSVAYSKPISKSFGHMQSECAVDFRNFWKTTNEHLRALAELIEPIYSFGSSKGLIVNLESNGSWLIWELFTQRRRFAKFWGT